MTLRVLERSPAAQVAEQSRGPVDFEQGAGRQPQTKRPVQVDGRAAAAQVLGPQEEALHAPWTGIMA